MEAGRVSMNTEAEKKKDIERLNAIYERLSEKGRIMMLTYSTAISDKEMADQQEDENKEQDTDLMKV